MADIILENSEISVGINLHGAELVSLCRKSDNKEYMWSGDSKYWGRVSPVLFPFVGKLNNQTYFLDGKEYTDIPQHGFARDCEFKIVEKNDELVWLSLIPSDLMKEKYPYECALEIGYELKGREVHVKWRVHNNDDKDMYFSIGAHPAFMCEDMDKGKKFFLDFNKEIPGLESGIINEKGVLSNKTKQVKFDNNRLLLTQELFAEDALIFDGKDIKEISIVDETGNSFLTVKFDAPVFGIWSPVGKNAPFVCIEPWYGRCDRDGFKGELREREFGNVLEPKKIFEREYIVSIEN